MLKLIDDIKNVLNKEKDFLVYEKNVIFDDGNPIEKNDRIPKSKFKYTRRFYNESNDTKTQQKSRIGSHRNK